MLTHNYVIGVWQGSIQHSTLMASLCRMLNSTGVPCLKEWRDKRRRLGRSGLLDARNTYKEEVMLGASSKAKGRRGQQKVVRWILDCFPSLEPDDVRSTPMGVSGPDVQLSPAAKKIYNVSIEVKNQERPGLRKAWEQADANSNGCTTLLFNTWNRGPELVTMKVDYYFTLLRRLEDERDHDNES